MVRPREAPALGARTQDMLSRIRWERLRGLACGQELGTGLRTVDEEQHGRRASACTLVDLEVDRASRRAGIWARGPAIGRGRASSRNSKDHHHPWFHSHSVRALSPLRVGGPWSRAPCLPLVPYGCTLSRTLASSCDVSVPAISWHARVSASWFGCGRD